MREQRSKCYTFILTRKGKPPVRIPIRPLPIFLGLAVVLGSPLTWLGTTLYSLHQRNRALSQTASSVLRELEVLDREVEELRRRAKLPQKRATTQPKPRGGQGGIRIQISPEVQLQLARRRLPLITSRFQNHVKPQLEKTLEAEAARAAAFPQGKPTRGITPISSEFGSRPGPFGGGYEFHNGIDLIGSHGTPIYATATGVVEIAENSGGYGNHVVINHGYGYQTLYAHLAEMTVTPKAKVERGQIIGYMGSTGRSTGTHLHYSIFYNGKAIDPKSYMLSRPAIAQR